MWFLLGFAIICLLLLVGCGIYNFCEQSQITQFINDNPHAVVVDKKIVSEVRMQKAGFGAELVPTLKLKGATTNDEVIVGIYRTQYNVINQGDVIATDSLYLRYR